MSDATEQRMRLEFLPNVADEEEGLNDSGIETYMDEPYGSVARECGQNSADAAAQAPVRLEFDRMLVPREDLDSDGVLSDALHSCLRAAKEKADIKATEFFERALAVMRAQQIPTLRIADYNTNGLRGPCEKGQPFHSLVKGKGVSTKDHPDSGGSFGIGKNAAYAISELRTVFYSTIYEDNDGTERFLSQGKSVLTSHESGEGARLAQGYWGDEGFKPVVGQAAAPDWAHRKEIGTTIHSVAFRDSEDWAERMAAAILVNFVVAIHRGTLDFKIDSGRIAIESSTLSAWLGDQAVEGAAARMSLLEDLQNARAIYDCLTATETVVKETEVEGLGPFKIRVLVREGMPKRLSIVRNGMVITDTMENFGDKFRSFPMYQDFVAVVEPADESGSAFIKRLENPKHDGLSAERIPNPEKRKAAHSAMRSLATTVRGTIRELAVSKPEEVEQIDELAEFFAMEDQGGSDPTGSAEEDPENYTYEPKVRVKRRRPPKTTGLTGRGGNSSGTGGNSSGRGAGVGDGTGGSGKRMREVVLHDTRTVIPDESNVARRRLWLTPNESVQTRLRILATALQQSERIALRSASMGKVIEGELEFTTSAGQRVELEVTLDESYAGPIEIFGFCEVQDSETHAD